MPRIVRSESLRADLLSTAQREALIDTLFEVNSAIFQGVDKEYFARAVALPKTARTQMLLHWDEAEKLVGFAIVHFFARTFRGRPIVVVRMAMASLPGYRGVGLHVGWTLRTLVEFKLAHPKALLYGLAPSIHPTTYMTGLRYVPTVWPRPGTPVPASLLALIVDLADEMGLPRIDPDRPLIRKLPAMIRETEAERRYWRTSEKPAVRFYMSLNPTYHEGHGLLVFARIDTALMARLGARMLLDRARRSARRSLVNLTGTAFGAHPLRARIVGRYLRGLPWFAKLDGASRAELLAGAELRQLRTDEELVRSGEPGDDLYFVARGVVSVFAPGAERASMTMPMPMPMPMTMTMTMTDQLGEGALVGAASVLLGAQYTDTARAATSAVVVRIAGQTLRPLMARSQPVRDALWHAVAVRLIDDHVRLLAPYAGLDQETRRAWIQSGTPQELAPGASVHTDGAAFIAVLSGTVQVEQGEESSSADAPLVLAADTVRRLRAQTAARIFLVSRLAGSR